MFGVTLGSGMGTCEELRLNIKFLAPFRRNLMYMLLYIFTMTNP